MIRGYQLNDTHLCNLLFSNSKIEVDVAPLQTAVFDKCILEIYCFKWYYTPQNRHGVVLKGDKLLFNWLF